MIYATGRQASRSDATMLAYIKRVDSLRLQARNETGLNLSLSALVAWIVAQHKRWAPSTVRQYRAALRYVIELAKLSFGVWSGPLGPDRIGNSN